MAIIKLDGGYNALPISYKRGNPIPLDTTAVWYDFEKLTAYAQSGVTAYVGQVLTYVDSANNTATAYVIANVAGDLEPIGTVPVGDEKSIEVSEDGTISLKGVGALEFERDILGEDGEPTGEKEDVQYQILMTKAGLTWVEPSKTTVEGLATLIDGLTQRVKALEDDRVTEEELAAAVKEEADRAKEAEKALGERIDAIDYIDADELAEAIKDFETKENVKNVADDLADYIESNNAALADVKATADAAAVKTEVEAALALKADASDLSDLENRVNAFLTGTGAEDALDSLQELINYIETHDDDDISGILASIQALENKFTGIDGTVKAYVDGAIEALKIGDYAKASDLAELANRVSVLEGKVDVDSVSGAIATAKQGAIDSAASDASAKAAQALADAKADAANLYATKEYVGSFTTGEDAYKDITSIVGYINKKAEETLSAAQGGSSETAASVALALQNYKNENDPKVKKNSEDITANANAISAIKDDANVDSFADVVAELAKKQDKAESGEAYAYQSYVDTKVNTLKNTEVAAAAALAQEAKTAAGNAQGTADSALTKASNNETEIAGVKATVNAHDTTIGTHTTDIANLKAHDSAHTALYEALKGTVDEHTSSIAGKAEQTALDAVSAKVATNEAAISSINDVKIPGIEQNVAKKANIADVYSKTDADNQFLAKAEKYDDTAVKKLISDEAARADAAEKVNAKAISDEVSRAAGEEARIEGLVTAEVTRAKAAEEKNAADIVAINALLNTISDSDDITSLKELALWVEEHGEDAAAMADAISNNADAIKAIYNVVDGTASGVLVDEIARVEKKADDNAAAILAINHGTTGILALANAYTDEKIANVPVADGETIVATDKKLSVAKVSTDVLEMGEIELVLYGGKA